MRSTFLGGIAALLLSAAVSAAPVTKENFMLRTTGDLIALCGVSKDDPNAIAAIHFCHGYYVGLDQYAEVTGRVFRNRFYCPPEGLKLTRDQAIGMFVDWYRRNAQYASEPPFDGVLRFAMATWPCPK